MERRKFLGTAAVSVATASLAACARTETKSTTADRSESNSSATAAPNGSTPNHTGSSFEIPRSAAGDLVFSANEYERRYTGIRKQMEAQNIDALIVTGTREWHNGDLGNLNYLGVPIDWETTYVLLPIDKEPIVLKRIPGFPIFKELGPGNKPIIPTPKSQVHSESVFSFPKEGSRFTGDHAKSLIQQVKKMGMSSGRIGVVAMRNFRADVFQELRTSLPDVEFVDAERIFLNMRYYKSDEEITFLKRSGYIADVGLAAAIDAAGDGAHDLDVYYAADKACALAGGPAGGFQLVGSGPWGEKTSNVMIVPGSGRVMRTGDMLVPEIGSNYKGYWTQLSVPISIGEPPDEFYEAFELCNKVYAFNQSQFRPGKKVWELDEACKEFTKHASNGKYGTVFGIQAGEHENTFVHDNYELRPGALAYNQPFFLPLKKPGMPFHVYGDAMIMTDGNPIALHQTKMELAIV